ncbi:(R)-mandelonitrile lyase [Cellulomonas sp. ICMP 17802]|uniref:(R)-mandelonitrile lyase n=1 Tax=Cellulomonas sp. ICMP 17802 TaxID=3239199 RepID=UPI00351BE2CE
MEITPLPPTQKGPAQWFTGDVWFDVLAAPPAPARLRANAVRFAPGAHTFWHRHVNGQTLHVTEGTARVGTRDGTVVELRPGQTVWTPPGEWHWHGAAPDRFMTHLAMWEIGDGTAGPDTEWAEEVTDEQYGAAGG